MANQRLRDVKRYKRDSIDLDEALSLLLHGKGLRALGRRYGISHTYMQSLLQEKFGVDITNQDITSLAKSLVSDYQGNRVAYEFALSVVKSGHKGEKFRSSRALNAATRWITLDEPSLLDTIACYHNTTEEDSVALRWYFVYFWINQVVVDLGNVYAYQVGARLCTTKS